MMSQTKRFTTVAAAGTLILAFSTDAAFADETSSVGPKIEHVTQVTGDGIKKGLDHAGKGIEKGAYYAEKGIKIGLEKTGEALGIAGEKIQKVAGQE